MVDAQELKDALEERKSSKSKSSDGEPSTHYWPFKTENDLKIYDAIGEILGTHSPSQMQTEVLDFVTEHLEEFQEEKGK